MGAWLFSCDAARAYRQLPLDPADWPPVCFKEGGGQFFMDARLPFSLIAWAAASCQDATSIISSHFDRQGFSLLNYIDDFMGIASSKQFTVKQFKQLQGTLEDLGLVEAKHKASPLHNT